MREGLREIAEMFAFRAKLFGVKAYVIRVVEKFFSKINRPRRGSSPRARHSAYQKVHMENVPSTPGQAVGRRVTQARRMSESMVNEASRHDCLEAQ